MITICVLLPHHHHQPRHLNHHKVCNPTLKIRFGNPTACSDNYDYTYVRRAPKRECDIEHSTRHKSYRCRYFIALLRTWQVYPPITYIWHLHILYYPPPCMQVCDTSSDLSFCILVQKDIIK